MLVNVHRKKFNALLLQDFQKILEYQRFEKLQDSNYKNHFSNFSEMLKIKWKDHASKVYQLCSMRADET